MKPGSKTTFRDNFFEWPKQQAKIEEFIDKNLSTNHIWFCVNLLRQPQRKKQDCLPLNLVWADLDECSPEEVEPQPQVVIESSPGRYQAIWRLDETVQPDVAEEYSKRVAYAYSSNGADVSGWDLTQLLRVPSTFNFKYVLPGRPAPGVKLLSAYEPLVPVAVFQALPPPPTNVDDELFDADLPDITQLPSPDAILYKYHYNLSKTVFYSLWTFEPGPEADWSRTLWRLINVCFEAGMSASEVLVVAHAAPCNKYERDNRPINYLWRDVCKAELAQKRINALTQEYHPVVMPDIVDDDELAALPETFVDRYILWGTEATDAVAEYHEVCAFVLLSAVLGGNLKLNTSYGALIPNIWALILGDSTLTRKTTAMRMAIDLLGDVDRELLLATDGSAEGLLTGLSGRPGRVSIFFKDEVSGFIDSINRKDYLAGMRETLTQLYDVPEFYTRRLRKETITVSSPVFIFFGGGIRDKVYSLITEEDILSGFIPRFLIVSGEADIGAIRPTGPATAISSSRREELLNELKGLYAEYNRTIDITIGNQETQINKVVAAILTDDAWERYSRIELDMATAASESPISMMALPTFERLSRSLLKMAVLLAATRQQAQDNEISVELSDVVTAGKYIQRWGRHTIDLIQNSGRTQEERLLGRVLGTIKNHPGINRGKLMQAFHLQKRQMDAIQETLDDRGLIVVQRGQGRGVTYTAI